MGEITIKEIRAAGLSVADAARLARVNYGRVWRMASGGLAGGLEPDEAERLRRVLAETRASA